jgi:hypothetical protein
VLQAACGQNLDGEHLDVLSRTEQLAPAQKLLDSLLEDAPA